MEVIALPLSVVVKSKRDQESGNGSQKGKLYTNTSNNSHSRGPVSTCFAAGRKLYTT